MPAVKVRDATGAAAGSLLLDDALFGVQPNVPLMHQVVTAQLAAARRGTQSTKTRAEVSGGGAKPFRQKGTGRARQGSTRAPHWQGGGVALGPKPRSYKQRTPKKMIRAALASALSDRAAQDRIAVVQSWGFEEPSTKSAVAALAAIGVEGKVLVVVDREDEVAILSFRNLPAIQTIYQTELNAYDVLCNDWIVFTPDVLPGEATAVADAPAAEVEDDASVTEAAAPVTEDDAPAAADEAPSVEASAIADEAPAVADQTPATADEAPSVEASAIADEAPAAPEENEGEA
jgi:large subunit ribosomal protein L4